MITYVKLLHPDAKLPTKHHDAAAYDIYSTIDITLQPMQKFDIPTGIATQPPEGYYGLFRDRSSMAKRSIIVLGGVIDNDFRGELVVMLLNLSSTPYEIKKGDKVVQMLLLPMVNSPIIEADELDATKRAEGGFGSSGR